MRMHKYVYLAIAALAMPYCASSAVVTISLGAIDKTLGDIAPHIQQYPLRFSSDDERRRVETEMKQLLVLLDGAVTQYPDDPELLFRDAFANAMGHNLDYPGCDQKSIAAYERLLQLQPQSKKANVYYGEFLAGTATRRQDSIKYFQKAADLGVSDAHYAMAFVYMTLNDQAGALVQFKEYLKTNPNDTAAKDWVTKLENRKVIITGKHEKPPDAVLVEKP